MVEGAEVELGVGVELGVATALLGLGLMGSGREQADGKRARSRSEQMSRICGKIRIRKCDLRKRNRDNH